jgi:formylglycine-generating enzyme required for sulfatase activity
LTSLALFGAGVPAAPETSVVQTRAGARPPEREIEQLRLCWCPPGEFLMGSPASEPGRRADEAQVGVTLSRGFWIGTFEVTQGQWRRLMGAFPDRAPSLEFGLGDSFPLYWVNFPQAEAFCRAFTARARAGGSVTAGWEFRLPTEAQWEYACRAGTTTATAFGDRLSLHQANIRSSGTTGSPAGTPVRRAMPVGTYPPNAWGIHDMHGNVFEWCRDWYHPRLPGGRDPDLFDVVGTANRDGSFSRVRRGGAWNDEWEFCRSAYRLRYEPERHSDHIGFRVILAEVT